MTTVNHSISSADGWVKIADDGVEFVAENKSKQKTLKYCFSDVAPAPGAPFHTFPPGDFAIRAGVSGDCYVANDSAKAEIVTVS